MGQTVLEKERNFGLACETRGKGERGEKTKKKRAGGRGWWEGKLTHQWRSWCGCSHASKQREQSKEKTTVQDTHPPTHFRRYMPSARCVG